MKEVKRGILLLMCLVVIAGCGNRQHSTGKGVSSQNTVDKVIDSQIAEKSGDTEPTNAEETEETLSDTSTESLKKEDGTVDYDLTQMNSDMVYATVYQMMVDPEQYEGKTFRINGNFYATYYEPTEKYYFYCIIQDATACCAQGLEFVWDDGQHHYPDEYPADNAMVTVEGTFETYREEGDNNLYCRLADASLDFS